MLSQVISEDLMVNHFLPGLRCLRTDMEHLSPEHEVTTVLSVARAHVFKPPVQTVIPLYVRHDYDMLHLIFLNLV